jgi:uncharacterized glyoxalase superfamily protein PhnB/predicted enzyme related to lactoylglutathione lyase
MTTTIAEARLHSVTAYLCAHDAHAAIDWYVDVLGAVQHGEIIPMLDDKVGHVELWFGDSIVYLSDEWPEGNVYSPRTLGGAAVALMLEVADVDTVYARAVERGAIADRPVEDQPYGYRGGWLRDPFGYRWSIQTPLASTAAADGPGDEHVHEAPHEEPFVATDLWNEVGYYTIAVPDAERARRFYNELFGWDLPAPEPNAVGVGMHNSSTKIPMGFNSPLEERNPRVYFRVRDVQAAAAKVRELGGEVLEMNDWPSGGNAVCRDDQGTEFDLWQPAEGY